MANALNSMPVYEGWTHDLRNVSTENRATCEQSNRNIASRLLQKVFAARTVVFQLFLELCIELDGGLEEKHKHMWLMFQLSEYLEPHVSSVHPFNYIINQCLDGASSETLTRLINRLDDIRVEHLKTDYTIYVIDEAQLAARRYPFAFMSLSMVRPWDLHCGK